MATTVVVRTDVSGTSFVLDVTALELTNDISTLDFEVTHNGAVNANYAKTSATQITYTGTNVLSGTKVVARRFTSVAQSETTFLSTTTASALTNALEKERLRIDELDARLSYTLAQVASGGISIGSIPVSDVVFGVGWNGDTTNAPSKNATYDKIAAVDTSVALLAPLASPALTGNPTAPTPLVADNDTSIATTAFVKSVASSRVVFRSTNTPTTSLTTNVFTTAPTITGVVRSGFGDSYASGEVTIGSTGVYLITFTSEFANSLNSFSDIILTLNVGTGDTILSRVSAAQSFAALNAVIVAQVFAGAKITPKAFMAFGAGTSSFVARNFSVVQVD